MTTTHNSMTGTDLHENKGVSSATNGQVATASGGTTNWKFLDASNLTGTGNPFGAQLLHIQERQSEGTGSQSMTSHTWNTRQFTTALTNEVVATINTSTNRIVLPAGTWWADIEAVSYRLNATKLRLRNISDGSTTLVGMTSYAVNRTVPDTNGSSTAFYSVLGGHVTTLRGRFTLAAPKTFEIQQWAEQTITNGGGTATAGSGEVEVYLDVKFWKVL